MSTCSISHEVALIEALRKDPEFAFAYLNDVLADGDKEECLLVLRRVLEVEKAERQEQKTKMAHSLRQFGVSVSLEDS